ncbi:MAG: hypothetical protein FWG55_07185 [Candidatus Bathyarchaeota archaeon]|nr:hypothetical protein [Candidatus Termiticorpusculum sp.]
MNYLVTIIVHEATNKCELSDDVKGRHVFTYVTNVPSDHPTFKAVEKIVREF